MAVFFEESDQVGQVGAVATEYGLGRLGAEGFWGGGRTPGFSLATRRLLLGGQRSSLERVVPPAAEAKRFKLGLRAPPTIATTCGQNIPCQEEVPTAALAGASAQLGAVFCAELDTMLDALEVALKRVPPVPAGQKVDVRVEAAVRFFVRHKKAFGTPIFGESCKNAVAEGQRLLAGVNAVLASSGRGASVVEVPQVEVSNESGASQALSKLRTTAVAVAVVAGAVVLAPIVWRLVVAAKR